jgi:hypothetical protein
MAGQSPQLAAVVRGWPRADVANRGQPRQITAKMACNVEDERTEHKSLGQSLAAVRPMTTLGHTV